MTDPASDGPIRQTADDLFARLTDLGIAFTRHDHPPLFTVDDSKTLRGSLPGGHCKNLFLRDKKGAMWLLVCLEDRAIDLKALGAHLGGARLSFGSPDRLMRVLGVIPGAVSPFTLINDSEISVQVLLDAEMLRHDHLNYHPLRNDMTLAVSPDGLMRFIGSCGHVPTVVDLDRLAGG